MATSEPQVKLWPVIALLVTLLVMVATGMAGYAVSEVRDLRACKVEIRELDLLKDQIVRMESNLIQRLDRMERKIDGK